MVPASPGMAMISPLADSDFRLGKNHENAFGMQVIANEHAEVLGFNEHLLSGATTLNLDSIVAAIHDLGGLAVASHVDREGFGLIGQLGFIPQGLPLDAIEVSRRTPLPLARFYCEVLYAAVLHNGRLLIGENTGAIARLELNYPPPRDAAGQPEQRDDLRRGLLENAAAEQGAAGMEGALPSVVAGLTSRPVIAVPTSVGYGASFGGVAALLGMLNSCASNVTVVNIDNGFGAGYMASIINRI